MICRQPEWGRGLLVYEQRDGSELLIGRRCAEYLDYLLSHRDRARQLLALR